MQFKDLVDEGYLPYRLSGTKTSTLAITVFTTFCGDLSSSDDQLIDVRRFFEFKGFDEPIKYSKARKSATDANEVITLFTHSLRGQDIKVVTDSSPIST